MANSKDPEDKDLEDAADRPTIPAHRVRLPRFIVDEDVGLGDAITKTTSQIGIRPCGGCKQRAAALNRWLVFSRRG